MYYNSKTNEILETCPQSITLDNGSIVTGENIDIEILAAAGYYTIRNDSPEQPEHTIENISERIIDIEFPYVDITRVWNEHIIVPTTISARQIRLWLINNDITLLDIENAIDNIPNSKLKEKTKIEWEYAPYIERNHPLISTIGSTLGFNDLEIDQAFIEANQL